MSLIQEMGSAKYEVEKFTGQNDFGLWRLKMRALLVQQGLVEALDGEAKLKKMMVDGDKKALVQKAHSAIILSFEDKVLRQVLLFLVLFLELGLLHPLPELRSSLR